MKYNPTIEEILKAMENDPNMIKEAVEEEMRKLFINLVIVPFSKS